MGKGLHLGFHRDYAVLDPAAGDVRQPSVDHDTLVLPSVQLLAGVPGQHAIVVAQADGTAIDDIASNGSGILIEALVYA